VAASIVLPMTREVQRIAAPGHGAPQGERRFSSASPSASGPVLVGASPDRRNAGGAQRCNATPLGAKREDGGAGPSDEFGRPDALGTVLQGDGGVEMALFLVERNFAEDVDVSAEDVRRIDATNEGVGVRWIYSFLSGDKRKTYCLYEAPNEEAILEAARRNNVPADVIIPVGKIDPGLLVGAAPRS